MHRDLYARVWTWAGRHRHRETNIGVAPDQIAVALRSEVDNQRWRWEHTTDLTPRVLGVTFHAVVVHIHPFIDGNGRSSRLMADLAFAAAHTTQSARTVGEDGGELLEYDWDIDRRDYLRVLGHFDLTRDAQPLVALVGVRPVGT